MGITILVHRAFLITITRVATVGNVIMFSSTIFTFITSISIFTDTLSIGITTTVNRSLNTTSTFFTSWEVKASSGAFITAISNNVGVTETMSGGNITVIVDRSFSITCAAMTGWESSVSRSTELAFVTNDIGFTGTFSSIVIASNIPGSIIIT